MWKLNLPISKKITKLIKIEIFIFKNLNEKLIIEDIKFGKIIIYKKLSL